MNLEERVYFRFIKVVYYISLTIFIFFGVLGVIQSASDRVFIIIFTIICCAAAYLLKESLLYIAYGKESSFQWVKKMLAHIMGQDHQK